VSNRVIACDSDKCTGCGLCELVCSAKKNASLSPTMSRIRLARIEPFIDAALTCRLCENAPCVTCCPRNALRQDSKTGVIRIDETKCTGCRWCIEACAFGAMTIPSGKKVVFSCDLCDGRPVCVEICPRKALELLTHSAISNRARKSAVARLR
jgi:carbon-monoxide dehydrogenase iron sulfur subunit